MAIQCTGTLSTDSFGAAICDVPWTEAPDPLTQLNELLALFLATPPAGEIQTVFEFFLITPILLYVVSWGYQTVISFAGYKH